jgi:hypothetical protein
MRIKFVFILFSVFLISCEHRPINEIRATEVERILLRDSTHSLNIYPNSIEFEEFFKLCENSIHSNCEWETLRYAQFDIVGYAFLKSNRNVPFLVKQHSAYGVYISSNQARLRNPELVQYIYHIMGHDSLFAKQSCLCCD